MCVALCQLLPATVWTTTKMDFHSWLTLILIGIKQFLFKRIASIFGVDSLLLHVHKHTAHLSQHFIMISRTSVNKCDKLFFLKQFCEGDNMWWCKALAWSRNGNREFSFDKAVQSFRPTQQWYARTHDTCDFDCINILKKSPWLSNFLWVLNFKHDIDSYLIEGDIIRWFTRATNKIVRRIILLLCTCYARDLIDWEW